MAEIDLKLPEVKVNTFRKETPAKAILLENRRLTDSASDADVRHLVFQADGYEFLEGQSAGVLPPGENENGKQHAVRLYSIASLGTDAAKNFSSHANLTLCVKRVVYNDETGKEIKGVASNYLCNLKPGDEVKLTGPAGRKFLLPAVDEIHRPYVFFATGTGIAPFRGMIQRLFYVTKNFTHPVFLFFGARFKVENLYADEFLSVDRPNFHYYTAFSREETTAEGKKMYVGDKMLDVSDHIYSVIKNPMTLFYICGLKGMESGITDAIRHMAEQNHLDAEEFEHSISERTIKEVY